MSEPDFRARRLAVAYRDARGRGFAALDIEAFDARPGDSVAICGPSGCGKSTFLYALSGLALAATGSVQWDGVEVLALSGAARDAWRRRHIGFVFQDFQLVPELSPLENVLLPARFEAFRLAPALQARARELLERFGVPEARARVGELSRGEAQRVALARALLFDPPIILADEPTASLDSTAAAGVIEALTELAAERGKLVIAVTHDRALAERCRRTLTLDHGRIVASAPPPRSEAQPQPPMQVQPTEAAP